MRIDPLVARSRVRDLLLQCPRVRDAMPRKYSDETTTRQVLPIQTSPLHQEPPLLMPAGLAGAPLSPPPPGAGTMFQNRHSARGARRCLPCRRPTSDNVQFSTVAPRPHHGLDQPPIGSAIPDRAPAMSTPTRDTKRDLHAVPNAARIAARGIDHTRVQLTLEPTPAIERTPTRPPSQSLCRANALERNRQPSELLSNLVYGGLFMRRLCCPR